MMDTPPTSKDTFIHLIAHGRAAIDHPSPFVTFGWSTEIGIESEIDRFVSGSLFRASSLLDDTRLLVNHDRVLGAATTARAAFETFSLLIEFFRRFKSAVKRVDGGEIRKVTSSFIFASLEFESMSQLKAPNIMDSIRSSEKRQKGVLSAYSILCEAVHPNWSGRIQHSSTGELEWENPTTQRLMVTVCIAASFSHVTKEELIEFNDFVVNNRKNLRNAVLF